MLKKIVLLGVMAALLVPAAAMAAEKTVKLKFSHAGARNSTWQEGAEKFAEIIKEKTNGKYLVTIFPLDELSGGNQVGGIELVQTGVTDMHLQDALIWSAVAKKSVLPAFPWLLPTYADVDKYMGGEGGEAMKAEISAAGVVCLAIGENGYRQIVNNRNAITSPDDMKGLKIRVPGSSLHVGIMKQLGADPVTMNQSEVYTSLQQGTIDACENTLDLLVAQKTIEVIKNLSFWNYSYDPLYLSASQRLWGSLSDDEKKIFQDAADEAMAFQVQRTREKVQTLLGKMGEFKVDVVSELTPEQAETFRAKVANVYQNNRKDFGDDLFKKFGYSFE